MWRELVIVDVLAVLAALCIYAAMPPRPAAGGCEVTGRCEGDCDEGSGCPWCDR